MDSLSFLFLFTGLSFLLGSLPFAVWIGKATTGEDIRTYGDLNPGATNVLRAGSRIGFLLAMALDISKGALPVGLAYQQWGVNDWRIVPIAVRCARAEDKFAQCLVGWRLNFPWPIDCGGNCGRNARSSRNKQSLIPIP